MIAYAGLTGSSTLRACICAVGEHLMFEGTGSWLSYDLVGGVYQLLRLSLCSFTPGPQLVFAVKQAWTIRHIIMTQLNDRVSLPHLRFLIQRLSVRS